MTGSSGGTAESSDDRGLAKTRRGLAHENGGAPGQPLRIHQVAKLLEVSPSAIRTWERHGLLRPRRSRLGYRIYTPDVLQRVRDIQRMRRVQGLNIAAIKATLAASSQINGAGDTSPAQDFGRRLRGLRRARQLALREVARRTGLAPSFISDLERGSVGSSASTLNRLAACYGVDLGDLLGHTTQSEPCVVRGGRGRRVPILGPMVEVEQLAVGHFYMDCERWTLLVGAASHGAYEHAGEEFIHVLDGVFEIALDGKPPERLAAGDSIYFTSVRPHAWRNPGPTKTVLLWVNCPGRQTPRHAAPRG